MSAPTAMPAEPLRPDELPVAGYRIISISAVLAVLLGALSAVTLVNPVLSPVAIAAVIAATVALRQIAAAQGQLIGRRAALAGLFLATLFFGWGISRYLTRQWALEENARKTAQVWLRLIQSGQLREALQFRLSPSARIMSPAALAEHYANNQEAAQELTQFTSEQLIKELATLKEQADVRFEEVMNSRRDGFVDRIILKYNYARAASPGGRQSFKIQLRRLTDESTGRPEWEIEAAQMLSPASPEE